MALDVLVRKLAYLRQLLQDLEPYRHATEKQVLDEHYKLERLLELLVMTATDLLSHLLHEKGILAETYRSTFELAGKHGLIPAELASHLEQAAGMRNILVHMYEDIDYTILHASIEPALDDFGTLVTHLTPRTNEAKG